MSLVEDALAASLAQERSHALLMILFAITALTLGAVGIYGVMAYSVRLQIREIGIRVALGAKQGDEVGRLLWGGMKAVLLGLFLGALSFLALGSSLSGLLHQVSSRDPLVLVLGLSTVAVVSLFSI